MERTSGSATLDRDSALPLWAQLHADLTRRLDAGEFEGAFPGELQLAKEYEVSRNTVREAMRRLRGDGVIVAERGRRPRLAAAHEIEQPLGAVYSLFASVEAAGMQQRSVVRSQEMRTNSKVASQLGLDPGEKLFFLERVRLADEEPLAVDRVWMPGTFGAEFLTVDFTHTALYGQLLECFSLRIDDSRERIRAIVPTKQDRRLLDLGPDQAALAIERLASAREEPVEWRRTIIRGDRFSLIADFPPKSGYQFDLAKVAGASHESDVKSS
ncbi:MAG: GntR family transcriptional regulator [Acidobacteria bacterium]|nr:GntR family transcriptional regulator [Acidobacteriota bacterium]